MEDCFIDFRIAVKRTEQVRSVRLCKESCICLRGKKRRLLEFLAPQEFDYKNIWQGDILLKQAFISELLWYSHWVLPAILNKTQLSSTCDPAFWQRTLRLIMLPAIGLESGKSN